MVVVQAKTLREELVRLELEKRELLSRVSTHMLCCLVMDAWVTVVVGGMMLWFTLAGPAVVHQLPVDAAVGGADVGHDPERGGGHEDAGQPGARLHPAKVRQTAPPIRQEEAA